MNATDKEILGRLKSLLLTKIPLHAIALFGSRARMDASPHSDMDVLVVVDTLNKSVRDYISECAWEAGFEHGVVVAPIVFSKEEWENGLERFSPLAQAVREEGVFL